MSDGRYRRAGRGERLRSSSRRGSQRSPYHVLHAAQALAGNAAVSEALAPRTDGPEEPSATDPVPSLPGLRLRRPSFDIALSARAFDPLLAGARPRSAQALAGALAGKRGRITTDWVAATGASAAHQPAEVRAGRRTTTIRGRIQDLAALAWERGDTAAAATADDVDLRRIAPARTAIQGSLRVRIGRLDLLDRRTDVEVALDGQGSIRLTYDLPRGSLELIGHDRGRGVGGLDWEYALEVPTMSVARAVWTLRPPEHGGVGRASTAATDDDDPDDGETRREGGAP